MKTAFAAITCTEREIALMQEYPAHLTADLVTVKLDERRTAVELSEPPAEPAAANDCNLTLEEIEAHEEEH